MLKDRVKHVSIDHRTFLRHWTRLQLLEYAISNRMDKVLVRIAASANMEWVSCCPAFVFVQSVSLILLVIFSPTPSSNGVRGLIVINTKNSTDNKGFSICLKKQNGGPITM